VTVGVVLPPCESQLETDRVSRPEKVVSGSDTPGVRNSNLNTKLPKTDPDGIKTGYVQVDPLVFGKHNKLGVSLPPRCL